MVISVCAVINHSVAFIAVVDVVMPLPLLPQSSTKYDALLVIFDVFQEDDEFLASEGGMILH